MRTNQTGRIPSAITRIQQWVTAAEYVGDIVTRDIPQAALHAATLNIVVPKTDNWNTCRDLNPSTRQREEKRRESLEKDFISMVESKFSCIAMQPER